MNEIYLETVERSIQSHGRARVNNNLLVWLEMSGDDKIEVTSSDGNRITLAVFPDSLVEPDQIRLDGEDLKKLGVTGGDIVTVRRKIPVGELVQSVAVELKQQLDSDVTDIKEKIFQKTILLKDETTRSAEKVDENFKKLSTTLSEGITPIIAKVSDSGKDVVTVLKERIPASHISSSFAAGLQRLKPGDASRLINILQDNHGDIWMVNIASENVIGRTIRNLTMPPDVIIAVIQHEDNTVIIPVPDTLLQSGDRVYLIGKEQGIEYTKKLLEG